MTGRDIIIYILENKLENEHVLDLMSVDEAAVKYEVGPETIRTWCLLGNLPSIKLHNEFYILLNKEEKT